jgi:hypothetical protein
MAGLAHLGVGLAAKPLEPRINVWILILLAWGIDFIWAGFLLAGLEFYPSDEVITPTPYSHSLVMSLFWTGLAALIAWFISKDRRITWVVGLVFFSHWIIDFISHPMTAVFPNDTKLLLFMEGSPELGLGVWQTQLGVTIGEYGTAGVGLAIYIYWRFRQARQKAATG